VAEQRVADSVQASVHVHASDTQVRPLWQVVAGSQSVQPLPCTWQTWTCAPEQRVCPSVHWFAHSATHAPPLQLWPGVQSVGVPQSVHPFAWNAHAWSCTPEQRVVPGAH
jgi:hypothetical protein